jgi:protein-S-isoprenylcysteine O-methyltransferase Ste14
MSNKVKTPFVIETLAGWHELLYNTGPEQKLFPFSTVINFQKVGTFFTVLLGMIIFRNWSLGSCLYLAIHGSYGFIWYLKHRCFPDPAFDEQGRWLATIGTAFVLAIYWVPPLLMVTGAGVQNPSPLRAFLSVFSFTMGIVVTMVADAQKYFVLKLKRGLITDGVFSRTRNPNYLGEFFIYGAFANLVGDWRAWACILTAWLTVFSLRIAHKEKRLHAKPEAFQYLQHSNIVLPRIFQDSQMNTILYSFAALVLLTLIKLQ